MNMDHLLLRAIDVMEDLLDSSVTFRQRDAMENIVKDHRLMDNGVHPDPQRKLFDAESAL